MAPPTSAPPAWGEAARDSIELRGADYADNYRGASGSSYTWLVADLDGDGHGDLVRRHVAGQYNRVFFGTDNGTYQTYGSKLADGSFDQYRGVSGDGAYTWLTGDVDGDGRTDLIRRHADGTHNRVFLSRYTANHTGGFLVVGSDSYRGTDGDSYNWLPLDLDGDGDTDLVRRHTSGTYNKLLFSLGDGTYAAQNPRLNNGASDTLAGAATGAYRWYAGDFDGDGRDDLARRDDNGANNLVLLSRYTTDGASGHLMLWNNTDTYITPTHTDWFVGDLDGDGDDDLIRRTTNGNLNRLLFSRFNAGHSFRVVAPKLADGSFEDYNNDGGGNTLQWITGDFDADGRVDLVRRSANGSSNVALLSRYHHDGDGHLTAIAAPDTYQYLSGASHTWLATDVTGDGYTDLVRRSGNGSSNKVLVSQHAGQAVIFWPGDSAAGVTYHSFRIPSIVRATDGTLVAIAEGRVDSTDDHGDIDIVYKRSSDGGYTWSSLGVIWDSGPGTSGNPTTVVDKTDGTIWLFASYNDHEHKQMITDDDGDGFDDDDGKQKIIQYGQRLVFSTKSTDHGLTWAPATCDSSLLPPQSYLDDYSGRIVTTTWDAVGPGTGIQRADGALVIPATNRNLVFSSATNTWSVELLPTGYTSEATIMELTDGRLMRNDRPTRGPWESAKCRWVSTQQPDGAWPSYVPNCDLPDPRSHASILSMGLNAPAVFINSADTATRLQMRVRLSYDDASSWPVDRCLFCTEPLRGGYSSMTQIDATTVGALVEYGAFHEPTLPLVFRRFNLAWAQNGSR